MDALQAERDQNITIDTAQIWFRTPKRQYVIIDAPGHKEFLKNMVTGAANAEAALLLIDAHEGVQEQSRRHGYLLTLLGIRQVAVLVNKMDLEGYSDKVFKPIEAEYRALLDATRRRRRSSSSRSAAKHGDNIAAASTHMPWWNGPTVLETLDEFQVAAPRAKPAAALPDPGRLSLRPPPHPGRPRRVRHAQGRRHASVLAAQQDQHRQDHRALAGTARATPPAPANPSASR